MLETSFWWMSQSKQKLFKHSSKLEWAAFEHNLSIGMQAINNQPFGDGRELIYRKGEDVRDPQKREEGANILTKALSRCKFEFHRGKIMVDDNPFLVERER